MNIKKENTCTCIRNENLQKPQATTKTKERTKPNDYEVVEEH
jgi:hypothetical protein